jgi:hypothetical protein
LELCWVEREYAGVSRRGWRIGVGFQEKEEEI